MANKNNDTNYVEFYRNQYNKIYKGYLKYPDAIPNIMDMAYFYSEAKNPMRNLPLAIGYINSAEKKYIDLVNDNSRYKEVNKLIKKKITVASIRKLKQFILDEALHYDESSMTLSECAEFLNEFSFNDPIVSKIQKVQNRIAYQQAAEINSIESYLQFANEYPNAIEKTVAIDSVVKFMQIAIDNAETEAKVDEIVTAYTDDLIRKYAAKKKSKIAYRNAIQINTINSYREFLSKYPSCDEYVEALEKLDKLLKTDFAMLKTPRQYADFAQQNTESDLSDDAVDSLIAMILHDQNVEALDIYLSEFPLHVKYNDLYQAYYRWHIVEGNRCPIELFAMQNPNYPFGFAITSDLEIAKKMDQINLNKPFTESKLGEYSNFIRSYMQYGIAYVALQRIIQPMIAKGRWNDAIQRVQSMSICFEDHNGVQYNTLLTLLKSQPDRKMKLFHSYAPKFEVLNAVLDPTGSRLYYTKQIPDGTCIAFAEKDSRKNAWTEIAEIRFKEDDGKNLKIFSFFENGNKMLVGKNNDIFVAQKDSNQWQIIETLPNLINSANFESDAYMAPDGSGMLFVSDRRGGHNFQTSGCYFHGDTAYATDLYFVPKTSKGWGKPVNLGMDVNTPYSERSPVLSKDLKTLYFTSDGFGGFGYHDIYRTTRTQIGSWTQWSVPENIGKTANTGFSELLLSLSNDEKTLYVSSNREGKYEIYALSIPSSEESFFRSIAFYVSDKSVLPLLKNTSILVVDLDANTVVGKYPLKDDSFSLKMFQNKKYVILSKVQGVYMQPILLPELSMDEVPLKYYLLEDLKKDKYKLPMPSVRYKGDTDQLDPTSKYELDYLAEFLSENPDCNIEIVNNVNETDLTKSYNLSIARSNTIKKYLIEKGVQSNRIIASGFGNIHYAKDSDTPATELLFRPL